MLPNSSNYSGLYLSWLLLFLCCPCIFNVFKLPCSYWLRLKFCWHHMWRIAKQWLIYHCWFPRGKGRFSQSNLPNIRARGQENQETGQFNKVNNIEWSIWGAIIFSKEGRDYITISMLVPQGKLKNNILVMCHICDNTGSLATHSYKTAYHNWF